MILTVSVIVFIAEGTWRSPQRTAQDAVDRFQKRFFICPQLLLRRAAFPESLQLRGACAELEVQTLVQISGIGGCIGLRYHLCRHQPVFFDQVAEHEPLSALLDWKAQQRADIVTGGDLLKMFQYPFKEQVCFL